MPIGLPFSYPADACDYRLLARRRLPRFLFDYVDGGAGSEATVRANARAWDALHIRQRVLVDVDGVDTRAMLAGEACALPVALGPVGLAGMVARRGEAQAARAAERAGVPFTLSTVGICPLDEIRAAANQPFWFQLYMLRDRGVVEAMLDKARDAGCRTLVFTVDLPLPGVRRRDVRHGVDAHGLRPALIRLREVLRHPHWVWDVALRGKPLKFGSLADQVPGARDLNAFKAWVDTQFDPSVTWKDIESLRARWQGKLLLKGILDIEDARAALDVGADGIIVSNHGGRQLDAVTATATRLPAMVEAIGGKCEVLVDGGIRSGTDIFKALALGAHGVLLGRPWVWALAGAGEAGVYQLLTLLKRELELAMTLAGVTRIDAITAHNLDRIT